MDGVKDEFEFFVSDGAFGGFVVNGGQVNGCFDDLQICDYPCPAGLSFSFGCNGQTDFVKIIPSAVPCSGSLASLSIRSARSFFNDGYFLARRLVCLSKRGMEDIL